MSGNQVNKPRFKCTGCGKCCTGDPAREYVEVSREEQKRIIAFLSIGTRAFRRKYLETAEDDSEGIKLLESGRCPFLDSNEQCSIYSVRPNQCLSYPFWPALISNQLNWDREKGRCEGIDKGPLIPEEEVITRLALHK